MPSAQDIAANFSRTVEMQNDDDRLAAIHRARLYLDSTLANFNALRSQHGLGPVTLRIPEETT